MANLRNTKEFRDEIITALGGDPTVLDTENELNFRGGILQALSIEYEPSDLTNFEAWRTKLVEAAGSAGGGGGGDYPIFTATFNEDTGTGTFACDWNFTELKAKLEEQTESNSWAGIFVDTSRDGTAGGTCSLDSATRITFLMADGSELIYRSDGTITVGII